MVRTRFTNNEKANNYKTVYNDIVIGSDDIDKRNAIKGYIKLIVIIAIFLIYLVVKNNYFDVVFVSGKSMENTFFEDDILVIDVISNIKEVKRFDVVVVNVSGVKMIKRVVGLPYDNVEVVGDTISVNDKKFSGTPFHSSKEIEESFHIKLGEDEYFLLGDNLDESKDSRSFGTVNLDSIYGIVKYQIYPFSDFGNVNNSYNKG